MDDRTTYLVEAKGVGSIDVILDLVAVEAAERLDAEHYVLTLIEQRS